MSNLDFFFRSKNDAPSPRGNKSIESFMPRPGKHQADRGWDAQGQFRLGDFVEEVWPEKGHHRPRRGREKKIKDTPETT